LARVEIHTKTGEDSYYLSIPTGHTYAQAAEAAHKIGELLFLKHKEIEKKAPHDKS